VDLYYLTSVWVWVTEWGLFYNGWLICLFQFIHYHVAFSLLFWIVFVQILPVYSECFFYVYIILCTNRVFVSVVFMVLICSHVDSDGSYEEPSLGGSLGTTAWHVLGLQMEGQFPSIGIYEYIEYADANHPTRDCPPACVLGVGLTSLHHKNKLYDASYCYVVPSSPILAILMMEAIRSS
jgi:hypothetical protein